MRRRSVQKIVKLNRGEAQDSQKKAERSCMSGSDLIRLFLKGYEPRGKPDEGFYDITRELSVIGNNINQLAARASTLGPVDTSQLEREAKRWHKSQADAEHTFLRPDKSDMKWQ